MLTSVGVSQMKILNAIQPSGLKFALGELDKRLKDPASKAAVGIKLTQFSAQNPQATDADYLKATENFIKPEVDRVLNAAWRGTWEVTAETLGLDKMQKSNAERMTEDIHQGDFIGRTSEKKDDLELYAAWMLRLGKQQYPAYRFISVSPDTTGQTTGFAGAAILLNEDANQYQFKFEGGELVLYGYLGTHGNNQNKSWQKIGKGGEADVAEKLRLEERKTAIKIKRKEDEQKAIEYSRRLQELQRGIPLVQEETP